MKRAKSAVPQPKESAAAAEEQHRAVTRETIRAVLKQAKSNDATRRAETWVGMPPPPDPGREPVHAEAIARAWAKHGITNPPQPTPARWSRRDVYGNLLASG